MKFTELENDFKVKNASAGRVVAETFSLPSGQEKVVNPLRTKESVLDKLEIHYKRENIKVEFDVSGTSKKKKDSNVVTKESVKNEKGDTHEHAIYDPQEAKNNKMINVESIEDSKAVEVEEKTQVDNRISKDEAQDFLEQHWKKVEKEVEKIDSIQKLEFILTVAKELGMEGNKKHKLVEERISNL